MSLGFSKVKWLYLAGVVDKSQDLTHTKYY